MSNLEYDHLSMADTRCVWTVHFRRAVLDEPLLEQYLKVMNTEKELSLNDAM